MSITWMILLGYAWLQVGYLLARVSWWVWVQKRYGTLSFLLFPESTYNKKLGTSGSDGAFIACMYDGPSENGEDDRVGQIVYSVVLAFLWPLKLVASPVSMLAVLAQSRFGMLMLKLLELIIVGPGKLALLVIRGAASRFDKPATEAVAETTTKEPPPNPRAEVQQIDEELAATEKRRQELLAKKAEIESDPEKGKVLKLQGERPCA